MYNPHLRFPKAYLDRVDVLTIDGRVLDAASWNVERMIWRPDVRLEGRDVDLGPRTGNYYLGPGWSLERREAAANSQEMTFVQPLTNRAVVFASLPAGASELVLRASSPAETGARSIRANVDGQPVAKPISTIQNGYGDIAIPIPPAPARPAVSTITLQFDTGGRPDFVFKLDRLTIR
jgi:hypothetical protein